MGTPTEIVRTPTEIIAALDAGPLSLAFYRTAVRRRIAVLLGTPYHAPAALAARWVTALASLGRRGAEALIREGWIS